MSEELKRADDLLIGQLVQELKDLKERTLEFQAESADWKRSINERLKPIEDFIGRADWAYKFIFGLAGFIGIVYKAWEFARNHWK